MNIYLTLTEQFNQGGQRAIISSGQAVVLHHLAIMSKDGDWIIKEDNKSLLHIIKVLDQYGAKYRFGAPMDKRWLAGGWSSHFEFMYENLRVRTDFVSRPPRINSDRLSAIWKEQKNRMPPYVEITDLIELKKTNREKDYVVIGDLTRKIQDSTRSLLYSRSARDILLAYKKDPDTLDQIMKKRGIQPKALKSLESLETALDSERRRMIHENEDRLARYLSAATKWKEEWKQITRDTDSMSLLDAHQIIVTRADGILPFQPPLENDNG